MNGDAAVGADPEEEEVPEEAGHGLAHAKPSVHAKVESVVLGRGGYSVMSRNTLVAISLFL